MAFKKHCPKCSADKPRGQFSAQRGRKDGLTSWCRDCRNTRHRELEVGRQSWKRPGKKQYQKGYSVGYALERNYGITLADYDAMLAAQDGRCAICKTDVPKGKGRFSVDHDHVTGKVRALLCNTCNAGLGQFKDDPALVLEAAAYLQRHANV